MKLIPLLKGHLLRLFDIKPEELNRTLLLQAYIFLVITTLLVVKPIINSLFLIELTSDALPLGYVLTALSAVIGSYFYNKALAKFQLNKVIEFTLIGSILSLLLFGLAFKFGLAKGNLLFIPYIWVAIFGLLAASQFWILANLVYNIREAKRVFGFIGAGAIAGGIFGGYFTSILTRIINVEDMFFVATILISLCIPILRHVWKNEVVKLNKFQISRRSGAKSEKPLKLIRQSKLLKLIALVIGLSVLVAKLVDYQYSDYASRLIEDPENLASFFGFWFSTLSLVSLVIQLFLTKRIVGKLGVGKSLLFLPAGILIGSITLIIFPQLWVIVFIKVIDGSFKQSVNKAATELLSIPIQLDIKNKTKTFIDVVIDSFATGIAGITLIFFINGLNIPSKYVSLIIISLIITWIYFIFQLKKEYINAFKNLFLKPIAKKKQVKQELPITSILNSVIKVLKTGNENQIIYMLGKTLEVKDERFFSEIKALLEHQSSKVRTLAIENLYFLGSNNLSSQIEPMIFDSDQEVTTAAFRYLLKFNNFDSIQLFEKYLNHNDHTINNAALIGLSKEIRNHKTLQKKFEYSNKLKDLLRQISELNDGEIKKQKIIALIKSIGNANVSKFHFIITQYLNDADPDIAKAATNSASKTLNPEFIDIIINNLSRKEIRESSISALFNYGEPIIELLAQKTIDGNFKNEDTRHIPKVIARFISQKAVKSLIMIIENSEHEIKIEALELLSELKWNNPLLEINNRLIIDKVLDECELYQTTLAAIHSQIVVQYKKVNRNAESAEEKEARNNLILLLESRLDWQLQRIFKYLGLKYPPNEINPMLEVFLEGKEEQRIQAIEFLDNILDEQLKKELIPIAETILINTKYDEKVKKLNIKIPSEIDCFNNLLLRNDPKLRQTILLLMGKTNNPIYLPIAKQFIENSNRVVKKQAIQTVEQLSTNTVANS